jgi:hypothetical protein
MLKTEKPQTRVHDVPAFLADLERGGALSSFQVQRLLAAWPTLADDWAADPYFGTVREHTRAYIDRVVDPVAGGA